MDDEGTRTLAGCATIFALIVVAPFIIAAVPVLLGAVLGVVAFFLIGAIVTAVVGAIFRK